MKAVPAGTFGTLDPVRATEPSLAPGSGPYPLVMVEWHDAWFDLEASTIEDLRPDYLVRTVGFLVGEGPRFVSLAPELLPDGEGFRAVTTIPLPIVERLVRLGSWEGSADR